MVTYFWGETLEKHTQQVTFDKNKKYEDVTKTGKFAHLGKTINWNVTQKKRPFIGEHGGIVATFDFDGIHNEIGGNTLYSKLRTLYLDGEVYDVDDLVVNVESDSVTNSSAADDGLGSSSAVNGIAFPTGITGEHEVEYVLELDSDSDSNGTLDISGKGWFNTCSGMRSVTLPNFIGDIDNSTFDGSVNIVTVIVDSECVIERNVKKKFYTIFNMNQRASLTNVILGDSITSIGDSAFESCSGLTSITIPDNVTSIGDYAFSRCSGLTSITIPDNVTSIGDRAFYGCSGLTSITIPDNVTSIGDYAFSGCSGLTSITIPDNVTSIGDYAFSRCSGLTSITIPDNVTSIGDRAFYGCSGLTSISVNEDNTVYDSRNNCNAIIETTSNKLIAGCKNTTIPDSVTSIGGSAFSGCSGLTSITIPDSVTSIGGSAFSLCSGLTSISVNEDNTVYDSRNNCNAIIETTSNKLIAGCKNTTIPDSVTSIGNSAFSGCSGLTNITIPDNVTSIGGSAFESCSGLTSVTINSNSIASKTYTYSSSINNIFGSQVKEYIIGDSVTSIGDRAFYGCSGLTSITIGNSVTSIGNSAFSGCSGLTNITIPDNVTSIGNSAFSGCSGLTNITIPDNVTSIGGSAFYNCSGLTNITIPDSVTSIGGSAFYNCSGLTNITIPDSVTSIGNYAFYGCSGLTSITIPDNVTSIGNSAFYNTSWYNSYSADTTNQYGNIIYINNVAYQATSSDITSCEFKEGTIGIGAYAFLNCSGLTNITIPDSVTSIGGSAFYNCSGLTNITYNGTMAQWKKITRDSNWHSSVPSTTTVTCSDGTCGLDDK